MLDDQLTADHVGDARPYERVQALVRENAELKAKVECLTKAQEKATRTSMADERQYIELLRLAEML